MCAAQVVYMRFSLLPLSRISVLEVCILGRVKCSSDRVTFGNFVIIVNPHVGYVSKILMVLLWLAT
jgi:hypothetical protein